jgi:hypothetical protein
MVNISAEKILARLKGLRARMREDEYPLFSIPAIWDDATEHQSNACDLVITNQRIFGYIYITFPRERLFLDALELSEITSVSFRQKSFEAVFRELFVTDGKKRIYIRAPRKKIEATYSALREAIAEHAPATHAALAEGEQAVEPAGEQDERRGGPTYSRERVRQPLERSPLGITILLVGGLVVEVIAVLIWATTGNLQTALPLFLAGLFAVIMATITRRQLR